MPRNGSGTMSLVHDWEDDQANGIKILASRMMAQQEDIRDEITNSVDKDGQTVWTGDMDAGDRKITNYGQTSAPNARDDVPFLGQMQDQTGVFIAASGVNDIGVNPTPAFDSYTEGKRLVIKAASDNTGAVTINVSALGAKTASKSGGTALASGDIKAGGMYEFVYNADTDELELVNSSLASTGVSEMTAYYFGTS